MTTDGESLILFQQMLQEDAGAESALFHRYVERLLMLARSRMSPQLRVRVDEEDVVQSVYRSFFARAREEKFVLERSGDLWRLLAAITLNKVRSQASFHGAAKRNANQEQPPPAAGESALSPLPGDGPAPDDVLVLQEEVQHIMQLLIPLHRQVIELRLQGDSVEDIAAAIGRTEHQVRRVLKRVHDELQTRLQDSSSS
jgi:RNA polymerase sigma-70 factor (ECF subfamily)